VSYTHHREYYRRKLPHYQPEDAVLFVTFRQAGSLPLHVLERLRRNEQKYATPAVPTLQTAPAPSLEPTPDELAFQRWDSELDATRGGPLWLRNPAVAGIVADSIRYRDGRVWTLHAWCVMPNHVHLICAPLPKGDGGYFSLAAIMKSLKGYTARRCNEVLQRSGRFWQPESYDRVIRDENEWRRTVKYVLHNPVSARLVDTWEEWPWSYCAEWDT